MNTRLLWLFLACLLLGETSSWAQTQVNNLPGKETQENISRPLKVLDLEFYQVTYLSALKEIADAFNAGLTINADLVPKGKVSKELKAVTLNEALNLLLQDTGVAGQISNNGTIILKKRIAPQERVQGSVTDEEGNPLPGVNVLVKGSSQGTVTDIDGNYSIQVEDGQVILVFSFVGYVSKEVQVNQQTNLDVALGMDAQNLNEVVVVGYGTLKKIDLTGSVASVEAKDFENVVGPNTTSLLQGRMSGVTVSSFAPQPGSADTQIRIRGIGTFNAGQNPLVVIDDVNSSVAEFNRLPPADIMDVTVLKDAASAAIYGARAANGVILVRTKQGEVSKPVVTLRSAFTRQTPLIDLNLLDSWEWAQIVNESSQQQGGQEIYSPEMIQKMSDGSDPDHFANTDWFHEVIKPATMQEYYLSVTGGSQTTKYLVSSQYRNQPGIMTGTAAKQFNIRTNVNIDVSERVRAGINIFGYRQKVIEPATVSASASSGTGSLSNYLLRHAPPTVPVRYTNGDWGTVDGAYPSFGVPTSNPVRMASLGEQYTDTYHLNGKLYGELEIIKGLSLKSQLSGIYNSSVFSSFEPTSNLYDAEKNVVAATAMNSLANRNITDYYVLNVNTLTYQHQWQQHHVSALAGQSIEYYREDNMFAYAEGFPNNELHELTAGVENLRVDGSAYDYGLFSLFGRVNYAFGNRYLLEANLRYDGSSRFPKDSRFGTFPSFSAGWVVSEEDFFPENNLVSFLKVRGSWGQLGNQQIGYYPYAQTLATGQDYLIGGELQGGAAITSLANANITWETTTITDIGVDINLLNNQIQVTADYFDKTASDILLRLPVPLNMGNVSPPFQNVGTIRNTGWELAANYTHLFNSGFSVNGGFNVSHVTNQIVDLGKQGDNDLGGWIDGNSVNVEGQPIGAYYGYIAEGYYQSEEEITNHAEQFGDLAPGDIKFKDLNQDGKIDPNNDRKIIGNPFPKLSYGINLTAQYKGFDVTTLWQGLEGINRWNFYNNEYTSDRNFTDAIKDHWTPNNTDAAFPRLGNQGNNSSYSTYYLEDASYLRLKHVELGYTLPAASLEKLFINHLRVYFSGYNLLTFSKMKDYDPEKATEDNRNSGYPNLKNYALGVTLKF